MRPTLIGLPFDAASSFLRGAAAAPAIIRQARASSATNLWSEARLDIGRPESLADVGDLDLGEADDARSRIEAGIAQVLDRGDRPISLGGDHSVTFPILRALGPRYPGLTLLHLDAHPDLYDNYEGDGFSHACPFARILEQRLAARLVQLGIRTMSGTQWSQASRFGVDVIDMRAWTAGVRPELAGPLYVSIDMDVFDPAFAPGVSHREPGGLSARDVIGVIQSLPGPIVGADIVEFNPSRDPIGLTAPLCAKLVKELASRMIETGEP